VREHAEPGPLARLRNRTRKDITDLSVAGLPPSAVWLLQKVRRHSSCPASGRTRPAQVCTLRQTVNPTCYWSALSFLRPQAQPRGEPFVSLFDKPQEAALAALFLRIHDHGFLINEIFAGLWLFPFGLLVFRSGFLPRILGLLLFVSGFGYVAISGRTCILLV
jgi:hypothetical protein